MCIAAAIGGNVECLKYVHENGCVTIYPGFVISSKKTVANGVIYRSAYFGSFHELYCAQQAKLAFHLVFLRISSYIPKKIIFHFVAFGFFTK